MTSQLLIVSAPELTECDRLWIEELRSRHDPHQKLIAPHFTLVFPTPFPAPAEVFDHAREVALRAGRIAFHLRLAVASKDAGSPSSHLFLVPDEGFAAIVELHDALYLGPLAGALRSDIPFLPHITVGSFDDVARAEKLAVELNRKGISIEGRLEAIDVVQLEEMVLTPLARFRLG